MKDLMRQFEEHIQRKEEAEMMEDFVIHNLDILSPREVAQAIREGVTKLETIEQTLAKL